MPPKKNFAESVREVFNGLAEASDLSAWRRHFDLSPTLKVSRNRGKPRASQFNKSKTNLQDKGIFTYQ